MLKYRRLNKIKKGGVITTMKATGIVRHIDELGRLVIPKEMRKTMQLESGTPVEIFADGGRIILSKYCPNCHFCGSYDHIVNFKGTNICVSCIDELKKTNLWM